MHTINLPVPIGTLLSYYGIVILSLLVVYITGWLIKLCLFRTKDNISALSILTCSILGLTSIVTAYSIVLTKGLTANWMILFLFLIYIYYNRKKKQEERNTQSNPSAFWKYISIICIINGIFFCYFAYRVIDLEQGMFRPYHEDFNYYAKLSQYLNLGYENRFFSFNFFSNIAPQHYHYFEIWTNAIMYKTFGLNALAVYTISLPMFFNSLIFMALLAIIEFRKKITAGYFFAAFVILLLSNTGSYISVIFPAFQGWMPLLESPKLLPIFLFLFFSILLFIHNRKYEAYYVLLILPVLNVISIVAVWGGIGIILLTSAIKSRKIDWRYWIPFLSIVLLFFIYLVQGTFANSARAGESFQWGLFRLYITQPIIYVLAYVHVIALIFFLDRKQLWDIIKETWIVFAVAFFISVTVSIFMRPYDYDATQFVSGIITVMVYVMVVFAFLTTITSIHITLKKRNLIVVFCVLSLFASVDAYRKMIRNISWPHEYEAAILNSLSASSHPSNACYVGFYLGSNDSRGNQSSVIVDAISIPDVLDYYYNNVFHIAVNKGEHEVYYKTDQSPFRSYYAKMKSKFPDIRDDEIRINFIRENHIEYIRVFKSASPSGEFLSHLSLIAEDAITGQRFYKVRGKE